MSMAFDVSWNRVLGPTPISQRAGKEFQLPAGRGKATFDLAVNFHAHQSSSFRIAVRTRDRHDVWRSRLCGATVDATEFVLANVEKFFGGNLLFIERARLLFDFKRTIAP